MKISAPSSPLLHPQQPLKIITACLFSLSLIICGCNTQSGSGAGPGSAGPGSAGGGGGQGGGGPAGGPGGKPPELLNVKWMHPERAEVTEYEEFTGRTWAVESVELRSRVSGYLEKIHFLDSAEVKEGDILFEIDRRQFEGEADRSRAAVAQNDARVKRLTNQMKRARELETKGAISVDNFETAQFDLEEAEAALNESRAQLSLAELNVDYATIRAPISGRIGRSLVDRGNLVIEDQTALATIVPQDQIHVYFDIDERTVLRLRREQAKRQTKIAPAESPASETVSASSSGSPAMTGAPPKAVPDLMSRKVQVALADSETFDLTGAIDFMDNQVDPATGTLRARAILENQSGLLTPGLFVRVRYPLSEQEEVLSIPEESIGSMQGSRVVYVARETDKGVIAVRLSDIEFGPLNGGMRAVRSGLTLEDKVITTGLHRLKDGMTIKLIDEKPAGEQPASDKPASGESGQPRPVEQPAR